MLTSARYRIRSDRRMEILERLDRTLFELSMASRLAAQPAVADHGNPADAQQTVRG